VHLTLGQEAAEVGIAGSVFDVEPDRMAVYGNLGPHEGVDASILGREAEFDRAMQVAGVGERHSGQFVFPGQRDEGDGGWDGERGVEE
jgi:hypothetical protein